MKHPIIQRVEILFNQNRYPEAITELKNYLSQYPDDFLAAYYLASGYLMTNQGVEARGIAQGLFEQNPESNIVLFLLAQVDLLEDRKEEAEEKATQLIQLDPENDDNYLLLAKIKYKQRYLDKAMFNVNKALELNAENIEAHNFRVIIAQQTGATESANESIEEVMAMDPGNVTSMANQGLQLLNQGKVKLALDKFKEALSIEPTNYLAQHGMKEALKSRNPLYKLFYLYQRQISKLGGNKIWFVIIGSYIGLQVLNRAADNAEGLLKVVLTAIVIIIISLFLLSWIINPMMNLILFTNKYGLVLLTEKDKTMAKATGLSLIFALTCVLLHFFLPDQEWLILAILFGGLMIPAGTFLLPQREQNQKKLKYFGVGILIIGLIGYFCILVGVGTVFNLALLGLLGYQFYFNKVMIDDYARRF